MTATEYIEKYSPIAVISSMGSGVLPSVKMAQAVLESSNGNSLLSEKYHNHFGIKSNKAWTGKVVNMNTGEVYNNQTVTENALFRAYDRDKDSFFDHTRFLEMNSNFADSLKATTPEEQIHNIKAAGYATDPNYESKILAIIDQYDLRQLDEKKKHGQLLLQC